VVRNGAYQNVPELLNPSHDAELIKFAQEARNAEIAIVYYAAMGIEVGGESWLIPVDTLPKICSRCGQGNDRVKIVMRAVSVRIFGLLDAWRQSVRGKNATEKSNPLYWSRAGGCQTSK